MRIMLAIAMIIVLAADELAAAHFRDGGFLPDKGVLETLRIEPRLPSVGESFKLRLSGSWPERNNNGLCFPAPRVSSVRIVETGLVQVVSNLDHDPGLCDLPPAQWDYETSVPAEAWTVVDGDGFLVIEHLLYSGINMLTGIQQRFDMRLGTHEVPAYLAAGYWISPDRPFEGVMIEQQGSRVLFYDLSYDRDTDRGDGGEPTWLLDTGEMYGNSVLARAYRYDWPLGSNGLPMSHPEHDDIFMANDSGAIIVNDYNHIRAFTRVSGVLGRYSDYQRFVFGRDSSRPPPFVPPLGGRWTLTGFDGRGIAFRDDIDLLEGEQSGSDQYDFSSPENTWSVRCHVIPPGTGECRLERVSDGARFDFSLAAFQGNLARGALLTGGGEAFDGVLVRYPFRFPAMEMTP